MRSIISLLLLIFNFQSVCQAESPRQTQEEFRAEYIHEWEESNCRVLPHPKEIEDKILPHGFMEKATDVKSSYVCFVVLRLILLNSTDIEIGYKTELEFIHPEEMQKKRHCIARRTEVPIDSRLRSQFAIYNKKFDELDAKDFGSISIGLSKDRELVEKIESLYVLDCEDNNS